MLLFITSLSLTRRRYKFFAALYEWREGERAKMSADSSKAARAEKFYGDNFKKVYDWHVETLTKLKMKVNAYHQVMNQKSCTYSPSHYQPPK